MGDDYNVWITSHGNYFACKRLNVKIDNFIRINLISFFKALTVSATPLSSVIDKYITSGLSFWLFAIQYFTIKLVAL